MTHNIHPYIHRLGIVKSWRSSWFAISPDEYRTQLKQDHIIRTALEKLLNDKSVSDIQIERKQKTLVITISTSRPGLVIGRNGETIEATTKQVKKELQRSCYKDIAVDLKVTEIRFSEVSANIVAENIEDMLKKRMPFRRVMKQSLEKVMANRHILGARIELSGRLGGAEMSRKEHVRRGQVPLQTMRVNIDYASKTAVLSYGCIGIKVFIHSEE